MLKPIFVMMRMFCDAAGKFGLRRFILTTQNAHSLYAQFGFVPFPLAGKTDEQTGQVILMLSQK